MPRPIIVIVGSRGGPLEKLEPVFAQTHLDIRHVPLASTALELVATETPAVIIVAFPLNDLRLEEFFDGLEKRLAAGNGTKVILLADEGYLTPLEHHLGERHVLLSPSWSPELLQRYVRTLLPAKRQRARRRRLRLEVELGSGAEPQLCRTEDISQSGMLLRTHRLLPVGSRVAVAISLPDQPEPVRATTEIVRQTDPDREKIRGFGLRFLEIEGHGLEALQAHFSDLDEALTAAL